MKALPRTEGGTLTPLAHGALNHCFGCGLDNSTGLRLRFFVDPDLNVVCRLRLARRFAGPPGHAHGGIIATLLDEAMSKANRARNILAMTRHMEVNYLRPVPLGAALTLAAQHVETHGRRNLCEAKIADASGQVLATGKAVFVAVQPDHFARSRRL
ncbi:MAG TPA: PaaI family thioesterase [Acidobacteriaceae bacterium]|nr:PaaI family thioesterase [Acidobacteriaceae bacterium]